MFQIKKFTLWYSLNTFSELKYKSKFISNKGLVSALLYSLVLGHVFTGILLSYLNKDLYYVFTREDGYIEYFTAGWLLATSVLCISKALYSSLILPKGLFYLAAIVFFVGFGEEISWGQRIIGFDTPADLEKINAQKEFNLHNIHLDGVNLNKLIFGKLLYSLVFIYFIAFPVANYYSNRFKNLINKIQLPIPTTIQSTLYTFSFISLLIIKEGEKWELQEFTLASFIFLVFMFAQNKFFSKNH